ncbi:MAG TPA: SH3 domain-containing protein [Kofleriaceae bacterium]|nr:SH3 domain-containing protein [Kofleriaceae bacterium]
MRVPVAILVLLLAVAGSPPEGRAEKVKTNQPTKLLSRPGERGKVLLTVAEGKGMTVLAKDGRWLKVRVAGRTGWVPRSKVDVSDEIVRNTRRRPFVDGRSKSRGFGGEEGPGDRIGADALGDGVEPNTDDPSGNGDDEGDEGDEDDAVVIEEEDPGDARPTARVKAKTVALADPDEDAEESFDATPGMVLYPTGTRKGKYTEVETEDGDLGYVLTSSLEVDEDEGGGARTRRIEGRARLGVTFVSRAESPGNGKVTTSAATLALGGGYLMPYGTKLMIGGEATYDYAKAIPGVRVTDAMMISSNTSIGIHNLRLRALGGYDLKKPNGLTLFGRLGFHYQSYQIADVEDLTKNKGKLPSEIIRAPAFGVGVAVPRLTKKLGLRASLDGILFSSVSQTKNLEDGVSPAARGALLEAAVTYRWRKDIDLVGTYDLTYFSMSFGARAPNTKRDPVMGPLTRGDQFHSFTFGLGTAF